MTRKVEFAISSPQIGMSPDALFERAALCEKLGYRSIWLMDHFWTQGMPDLDLPECLTMMSALAARTSKIRIGALVFCGSYRNPAMLAKSLTTLDWISNGRLEVGLGAGWMEEEYRAYGYEFAPIAVRLAQLEEELQILKLMFCEKQPSFEGRYYSIRGAINNPKPVQKPHPPITIAGAGERKMLRLVAKYADRWNCPAGYQDFEHKYQVLRKHCESVGRDPGQIEISEQLLVCIGTSEAEVAQKWRMAKRIPHLASTGIKGTPEQIAEQLRRRVEKGITTFMVFFSDFAPPETLELFRSAVMPAFE